jgi:hypothetical protein
MHGYHVGATDTFPYMSARQLWTEIAVSSWSSCSLTSESSRSRRKPVLNHLAPASPNLARRAVYTFRIAM